MSIANLFYPYSSIAWLRRGCLLLILCSAAALAEEQKWLVNLNEAELRDVVREMSSLLGKTVVLDPRVKGRITVMSERELDLEGVRELFFSVLQAHGFAAIDEGPRLVIVPAVEAKGRAGKALAEGLGMTTRVVALGSTGAADLATLLRPLVSPNGYIGPSASANALVLTDTAANVERISALVQRLDLDTQYAATVLSLKHVQAQELLAVLEPAAQALRAEPPAVVLADTSGNRLVLLGTPGPIARLKALASSLDAPLTREAEKGRVLRLRHSDAQQLAEVLEAVAAQLQALPAKLAKDTRAQAGETVVRADVSQNALVIVAEPGPLRTLEHLVRQLDQPRAQVLIQAAIVEVSGDISQALGVQWGGNGGDASVSIGFPGAGATLPDLLKPDFQAPEGGLLKLGNDRFGLLISALANDSHSNLLSTPSLLTLDNQEAEILVGQNVPFVTGSYTTSGSGSDNPFTTVERKDIGIGLKIKPHINEGATLRLEVEQESSEVAPSAEGLKDLITNKRALKSTILADDGEIIVIGGLLKDSVRQQETGIPGLRSVPWVGALFRWTKETHIKTNLMIFLRPTIVRGAGDAEGVTRTQYNALKGLESQKGNSLLVPAEVDGLFKRALDER